MTRGVQADVLFLKFVPNKLRSAVASIQRMISQGEELFTLQWRYLLDRRTEESVDSRSQIVF
jgi:hypothetical protein